MLVQFLMLIGTIYAIRSALPKQQSAVRVDASQAAENLTTGYDRLLAEKDKQLQQRDQSLAEAMQQVANSQQQARQIEALETELREAKAELAQRQDLQQLQALLTEILPLLKRRPTK